MEFFRDPLWQSIGVILSTLIGLASLFVAIKSLPSAKTSFPVRASIPQPFSGLRLRRRRASLYNSILLYTLMNLGGPTLVSILVQQSWWPILWCFLPTIVLYVFFLNITGDALMTFKEMRGEDKRFRYVMVKISIICSSATFGIFWGIVCWNITFSVLHFSALSYVLSVACFILSNWLSYLVYRFFH